MSNKSEDFIGMPPASLYTQDGDKLSNTDQGNPLGDQVNNSAGTNVQQSIIDPKRQSSGHSLGMYSKPSWLCH